MTKAANQEQMIANDFTIGRQGIKIPLLGPVERFRVKDAQSYVDKFWVFNGYGEFNEYGRPMSDLRRSPSLVLERDGNLPTVLISGSQRFTGPDERRNEVLRNNASPETAGIYTASVEQTGFWVPGPGLELDAFFHIRRAEIERHRGQNVRQCEDETTIVHQGRELSGFAPEAESFTAYRAAHRMQEQLVHMALSETVQLLSLPSPGRHAQL